MNYQTKQKNGKIKNYSYFVLGPTSSSRRVIRRKPQDEHVGWHREVLRCFNGIRPRNYNITMVKTDREWWTTASTFVRSKYTKIYYMSKTSTRSHYSSCYGGGSTQPERHAVQLFLYFYWIYARTNLYVYVNRRRGCEIQRRGSIRSGFVRHTVSGMDN